MEIVYVVLIHEDSVDELNTKTYVHRTTYGVYKRLCDYIQQLSNYDWECDMPRRPTYDEINTLQEATSDTVTLYKIGDFEKDRFAIEFTVQKLRLDD
jgi:hypothetical protein